MNRPLLIALAGSLLLAGCAANSPQQMTAAEKASAAMQPDWITQTPSASGMAYGVGSMEIYGDPVAALKRAADLARVDLLSQLKVTVSGDFSSTTTETSGSGQETQVQRSVSNYARSQVPVAELDGLVIAETYSGKEFAYALAELDRNTSAAHLQRDIADTEQSIREIAAQETSGSRLQQLQPLLPALTLFAQREQQSERLQLVSMDRRAAPLSAELRQIEQDIYDRIGQLRVAVRLLDQGADSLRGDVIEALTDQGLRVQESGAADLLFDVSAELTNKHQAGNYYVFADSRITIRDAEERVLSSFSKQAKGVSGLQNVAQQKAARAVARLIGDELAVALIDKLH